MSEIEKTGGAFFYVSIIPLIIFLIYASAKLSEKQWLERQSYIENFQFPDAVHERVCEKYPHLGEDHINQVMSSLKTWFLLCGKSSFNMISMPSQVVDTAWHEFILFTRQYEEFCQNATGCFIHHRPAEAMETPTQAQEGIRRTWELACGHEGINPKSPSRLPMLFAIDTLLDIPDGFRYVLDCSVAEDHKCPVEDSSPGQSAPYCASHIGIRSCGGGGGGCGCGGGCGGGG
ncbi:MAG: glycine-rich domain-containing protein [Pseudomonadota bacterium]